MLSGYELIIYIQSGFIKKKLYLQLKLYINEYKSCHYSAR